MSPLFQTKRRIVPLSTMELEASEDAANKSLYLCNTETQLDRSSSAFVIHTIKLSDLLLSSSSSPVPLRKVASYTRGYPLPEYVGCGVLGSQIFFNGGLKRDIRAFREIPEKGVYTFDTKVPEKPIRKLDANLNGAKCAGLTKELCGKLYALPCWVLKNAASFEVFDPKLGSWESDLPQPPFFTPGSRYYADDHSECIIYSYLVAGTKIFVSTREFLSDEAPVKDFCPVFCFDAAHPEREWRKVSTMCGGGSFRFDSTALVLDIDDDDDKKIVFAYTHHPAWCLQVYLMSLCDNQETITEIGRFKIPKVPPKFGRPRTVKLIHIGGNESCVAVTAFNHDLRYDLPEVVTNKHYCLMFPFRYELDRSTKDENNCLTLDFLPRCYCFEYETDRCHRDQVETGAGVFLL